MILHDNDVIVFTGDSVTDMGRALPDGEGFGDGLGNGYVRIVENLLVSSYPEITLRIINQGTSGNTSRDLLTRYGNDVLRKNPDYVAICIGVNDIWRQLDLPQNPDAHVYADEYEANLRKMIESTKDRVKDIFLITPYVMETNKDDAMRKLIDEYGDIVKSLANEYSLTVVDFQKAYDDFFEHRHPTFISWDRIHPNQIGSTIMAREFLKAVDFEY